MSRRLCVFIIRLFSYNLHIARSESPFSMHDHIFHVHILCIWLLKEGKNYLWKCFDGFKRVVTAIFIYLHFIGNSVFESASNPCLFFELQRKFQRPFCSKYYTFASAFAHSIFHLFIRNLTKTHSLTHSHARSTPVFYVCKSNQRLLCIFRYFYDARTLSIYQ